MGEIQKEWSTDQTLKRHIAVLILIWLKTFLCLKYPAQHNY